MPLPEQLSEQNLRNVMDERSTVPEGSAHRPDRLTEVHGAIRRSRRRRTTAAAMVATGGLAVAFLTGPALLPKLGLIDPVQNTTTFQPAGETGTTTGKTQKAQKAQETKNEPFTVRLDDFADAEALVERLRGLGIEAVAVDEVLDIHAPAPVLGRIDSGYVLTRDSKAGEAFTFDPEKITDGRIVVAAGMVDGLGQSEGTLPWRRPVVAYGHEVVLVEDETCRSRTDEGASASGKPELIFEVFLGGEVVPAPVCAGDAGNGGR